MLPPSARRRTDVRHMNFNGDRYVYKANSISESINRSRELKAKQNMTNGQMSPSGHPNTTNGHHSHDPPKTLDLQQQHQVARVVQAFQTSRPDQPAIQTYTGADGQALTPLQDAKISRDVEILNKCIEEVERFVVMLKRINEARRQLQTKKKKKKENILVLQAQPPPDKRVYDIFQKFKHSFNLLAKLQPHINNPNARELVHYLFIPLGIIVKVTGLEKARAIIDPLFTETCVNMLKDYLDSREFHFWQSLGPSWTLAKTAEQFASRVLSPYIPVFEDGWVPPEIVVNEKQKAAVQASAQAVARIKHQQQTEVMINNSRQQSLHQQQHQQHSNQQQYQQHSNQQHQQQYQQHSNQQHHNQQHQQQHSAVIHQQTVATKPTELQLAASHANNFSQPRLMGIVVYDYLAHNNKELTIRAGERVQVLDNSRRWWSVRNDHGEQGYVPSTVLEIPVDSDTSSQTSSEQSSPLRSPVSINGQQHHSKASTPTATDFVDSNQNYVNGSTFPVFQNKPTHTVTPVVINVKLPEGTSPLQSPHNHNIQNVPPKQNVPYHQQQQKSRVTPAQHQVLQQKTSIKSSSSYTPHRGVSPPQQHQAVMPPAPPPPPPPPMPSQQQTSTRRVTGDGPRVTPKPKISPTRVSPGAGDLHSELKNRLSIHMLKEDLTPGYRGASGHNNSVPQPGMASVMQMDEIDAVDVFIPLYKSSTADDVSRWLHKLGFSQRTIDILRGKTAHDLFKIKKDWLVDAIGRDEGIQLYEELQVQNGASVRTKTLTEFQKALVRRVQKREIEDKQRAFEHHSTSATNDDKPKHQDTVRRKLDEQSEAIKRQQEELEKLKQQQQQRNPGSSTFTTFAPSPQAKTKV